MIRMTNIDPIIPLAIVVLPIGLYVCFRIASAAWYAGKLDMIRKLTKGGIEEDNGKK